MRARYGTGQLQPVWLWMQYLQHRPLTLHKRRHFLVLTDTVIRSKSWLLCSELQTMLATRTVNQYGAISSKNDRTRIIAMPDFSMQSTYFLVKVTLLVSDGFSRSSVFFSFSLIFQKLCKLAQVSTTIISNLRLIANKNDGKHT